MALMKKTPCGTICASTYETRSGIPSGMCVGIYNVDDILCIEYDGSDRLKLLINVDTDVDIEIVHTDGNWKRKED